MRRAAPAGILGLMTCPAAGRCGPHRIMKEWADKYKGKFDDGSDKYRERVFERAEERGWIPPETLLTPRQETTTSWESIPEDEKPFQRRLMEVAAGFAEHVDIQVGRLVDTERGTRGHRDAPSTRRLSWRMRCSRNS